jgi:hypothetical protein
MHIVKGEGIQSFLRKPEQEEPIWRLRRIIKIQSLKEIGLEVWIVFVMLMIRVSGGLFCT